MRKCKTVKETLETGARLGGAAYEGNEYLLRSDGDTTWFCCREPKNASKGQMFIPDMTLAVDHHLIRALVDEDWRPTEIRLCGEPTQRHRGTETFRDCRVHISSHDTALGFPTEFLSRRLHPGISADDVHEDYEWISAPLGSAPIVDSLFRLIASRFAYYHLPTLSQVARIVGVSPATLKRALCAEGMTYQELLDRLRFDAACEMLAIPQMSIHDIAQELGYSGTNNFVRSFRRMTGVTPGIYRRQKCAPDGRSRPSIKTAR